MRKMYILLVILVLTACSREALPELICVTRTPDPVATASPTATTSPVTPTPTPSPTPSPTPANYGVLQEVVENYGLPIELRFTEGMGIIWFECHEDGALREWHHSRDGDTTHEGLSWEVSGAELTISGAWEETFLLDVDRGTASSQTDDREYRILVPRADGDGGQALVPRAQDTQG